MPVINCGSTKKDGVELDTRRHLFLTFQIAMTALSRTLTETFCLIALVKSVAITIATWMPECDTIKWNHARAGAGGSCLCFRVWLLGGGSGTVQTSVLCSSNSRVHVGLLTSRCHHDRLHTASLPLGYNHPAMLDAVASGDMQTAQVHRSALGVITPDGWSQLLGETLGRCAPAGMHKVQTMGCGSCANENAFKVAMICQSQKRRQAQGRGVDEYTDEENASVMLNQEPGAPKWSILSFDGAFHGRTFGALSCTRSQEIHKLDVAQLDWPVAPFPQMQYPLEEHAIANAAEVQRCLDATREVLRQNKGNVAAMIIEPIQAEGGDRHAPAEFFQQLRQMALDEDVVFIVDEVQTGCGASGAFWAHSWWNLETPPDIVTFGKKSQIAGYYYTNEMQMTAPYRIFNTWMGDPAKLLLFKSILQVVEKEHLVARTYDAGTVLLAGMEALAAKYPDVLSSARGAGTLCAIDFSSTAQRNAAHVGLRSAGVLVGICGKRSMRLRPPLTFAPHHAEIFLDRLEHVVQTL
eukprot:m.692243 g.692243  ORF g.692243 m.692243 type:complete len:522 (+) comp22861_c2_seq1:609-2174(+)